MGGAEDHESLLLNKHKLINAKTRLYNIIARRKQNTQEVQTNYSLNSDFNLDDIRLNLLKEFPDEPIRIHSPVVSRANSSEIQEPEENEPEPDIIEETPEPTPEPKTEELVQPVKESEPEKTAPEPEKPAEPEPEKPAPEPEKISEPEPEPETKEDSSPIDEPIEEPAPSGEDDPNFATDKSGIRMPVRWPALPKEVSTESANTAKDREWWDDEILRCALVKLRDDELLDYEIAGSLVFSPLEVFSLVNDGQVEPPPRGIKRLFLPLHTDGTHWCLLEVFPSDDLNALYVTLFDSLPILKVEDWFECRWHDVRRAVEGLVRCGVLGKLGWKAKQIHYERIDRQQTNIYDCGPFTVEFLKKRCQGKRGDNASPFEAAKRREAIQQWLKSGEVYVQPDRATLERIKAETEVIAPSKNLVETKSRLRDRLNNLFSS